MTLQYISWYHTILISNALVKRVNIFRRIFQGTKDCEFADRKYTNINIWICRLIIYIIFQRLQIKKKKKKSELHTPLALSPLNGTAVKKKNAAKK